jgi:hypothetical protein
MPTFSGHIDMRAQAEILSVLRPDTPTIIQFLALRASV